jgi:hypothetical protein
MLGVDREYVDEEICTVSGKGEVYKVLDMCSLHNKKACHKTVALTYVSYLFNILVKNRWIGDIFGTHIDKKHRYHDVYFNMF